MKKSTFIISKMDCPSEEQMIRMKLETYTQVKYLDFDIPNRKLEVYHLDAIEEIRSSIAELKFNETLQGTEEAEPPVMEDQSKQKKILWWVLGINFGLDFFFYGYYCRFVGYVGRLHRVCVESFCGRPCYC